jgi:hypothetical protein
LPERPRQTALGPTRSRGSGVPLGWGPPDSRRSRCCATRRRLLEIGVRADRGDRRLFSMGRPVERHIDENIGVN